MQVIRNAIVHYFSNVVEMGHIHKLLQNRCMFAQFTHNGMNVQLTTAQENPNLEAILEVGNSFGLMPDAVQSALNVSPELLNAAPIQWENCFSLLSTYGFSSRDCLGMITNYPKLLVTNTNRIEISLAYWRSTQIGDKNLLSLLKYHPQFLTIEAKQIENRFPLLKSLTTNKNLIILLKKCPNLMFQNWKEIENKMNYLRDVMKIQDHEMVKSAALSLTMSDLVTRHMFLERCGHFIPVKVSTTPNEQLNKNPTLSHITDTSDKKFATKIAGLSLEEYEVFQELYAVEREKDDKLSIEDSDSDAE